MPVMSQPRSTVEQSVQADSVLSRPSAACSASWREPESARPPGGGPERRLAQPVCLTIVATVFLLFTDWHTPPVILLLIAAGLLALNRLAPRAAAAVDRAMRRLALAVGYGLNWLLLTPCYYCIFLPGRLVMRLAHKDPMCRKFPAPEHDTFWQPCEDATGRPERYRWQH